MSAFNGKDSGLTPLMQQFHAIKEQHPDKLLFFRMGDFYELFGDDAVTAAPVLGIALTSRSHGAAGERIPLAGVPHHSADRYLARLLKAGHKVVVVEQVEDPRTAKGIVKRDIVEILTPGTATVEEAADGSTPPMLAAVCSGPRKTLGLAALDLNTGAFLVDEGDPHEIGERLRVLEPTEVIYPADGDQDTWRERIGLTNGSVQFTDFGEWNFDYRTASRELNQHFGTSTLDGFGVGSCRAAIAAAGAVMRYLRENRHGQLGHINRLTRLDKRETMTLDYTTVRNLELVHSIVGGTGENSLLSVVDRCLTAAGSRRLRQSLLSPFRRRAPIERRQSGVAELVRHRDLAAAIRGELKGVPDLERLAGRLGLHKLNPRQMAAINECIKKSAGLARVLEQAHSPLLSSIGSGLPQWSEVIAKLDQALVDEPPLTTNKGNILRRGYSEELDRLNDSIKDARVYIASLQQKERKRTGISSLKVGYNKVFGYYLEVTRANAALVPKEYIRKQTLVNAERYITEELKEKEDLIVSAEEKIFRLEEKLYQALVDSLEAHIGDLLHTAHLIAELDLVAGLAELAVSRGYCRPEIFEDRRLLIEAGRHPVIESVLPPGSFVANDAALGSDNETIIILTGPNMSGKSTYLRQLGLIVILAQIGSFVPADKAQIGLVDRVFTRVGALDDLARGQSTFLVEMVETANIMHNATDRSLVLLDEVGRGTSTFDGLSVAWSVVEYISDHITCRTVFATHYHELTAMAELFDKVRNYQVAVKKWEDRVVFLHQIIPGGCDDSYGIEVARLAGLPRAAIGRAKQILRLLESGKFSQSELGKGLYQSRVQPSLFDPQPSVVEERLKEVDPDNMTPLEALQFLKALREEIE